MAKLKFCYGEMGSGKTTDLILSARALVDSLGDVSKVIVMKPKIDTKNGSKLLARGGEECDVNFLISKDDDLFEVVSSNFGDAVAVFVDEAQFLTSMQIDQLLKVVAMLDMDVTAYGLRLNFNLGDENFAGATRLLQVAHEAKCLESKCEICGEGQAIFSCLFDGDRVAKECPTILISDGKHEVNAKSICVKCYYKLS